MKQQPMLLKFSQQLLRKIFMTISISISLFLFAGAMSAQSPIKGVTTVLVIDVSTSMSGIDPDYRALDSAKLFVDLLSEGDEVGLVFFHGGIASKAGLFTIGKNHEKSKKEIKEIIGRQRYNGGTEIIGALQTGLKLLQTSKNLNQKDRDLSIILMTDGDDGRSEMQYSKMKIQALKSGVEIHPIAFGSTATQAHIKRKFSLLSSKEVLSVQKAEDFPRTFATIFGRIHDVLINPFTAKGAGFQFKVHPLAIETNMILTSTDMQASHFFTLADPSGNRHDSNQLDTSYFGQGKEYRTGKLFKVQPGDKWSLNANFPPSSSILFQIPDLEFRYSWGEFREDSPELVVKSAYLIQKSRNSHYKEKSFYNSAKIYLVVEGTGGNKEEIELKDDGSGYDRVAGDLMFAGSKGLFTAGVFQYYLELRHDDFRIRSGKYVVAIEPLIEFHIPTTADILRIQAGESYGLHFQPDDTTGFSKSKEVVTAELTQDPSARHDTIQLKSGKMFFSEEHKEDDLLIRTKLGHPWFFFSDATPEGKYSGKIRLQYMNSNHVEMNYEFMVEGMSLWEKVSYTALFYIPVLIFFWIIIRVKSSKKFPRRFHVMHVTPDILQDSSRYLKRIHTNWLKKETSKNIGGIPFKSTDTGVEIEVSDPNNPENTANISTDEGVAFSAPNRMIYTTEKGWVDEEECKRLVRQYKSLQETYGESKKLYTR